MEDNEKKVLLDGNEVTNEQLAEAQKDRSTRIAEKKDGSFVTLKKLRGKDD